MLRIYTVSLRVAADAADAADRIGRKDPDLARQLRRAAASTPLNIAEGAGSLGKNRRARYANALGSDSRSRSRFRAPPLTPHQHQLARRPAFRGEPVHRRVSRGMNHTPAI